MGVGEMIALHHRRDALARWRQDELVFWASVLGQALARFETAVAESWIRDTQLGYGNCSERGVEVAQARADKARDELKSLLRICCHA